MTREEAIWYLTPIAESASLERYKDALGMALDALRAQQEAEKNAPLTLGELREMDGKPVWVEERGLTPRWALVFRYKGERTCGIFFTFNNSLSFPAILVLRAGGKAYRRKPEEGPKNDSNCAG